jgi:hypothetical protein
MSRICRRPMLGVVVALALAIVVASTRSPGAEGPDGSVEAIKKVLDKQEQDWNKGDLDAFLEGYWNSPGDVYHALHRLRTRPLLVRRLSLSVS